MPSSVDRTTIVLLAPPATLMVSLRVLKGRTLPSYS